MNNTTPSFIKTGDGNITLIYNNKSHSIGTSHLNYNKILECLKTAKYDGLETLMDVPKAITSRMGVNGVTVSDGQVFFNGTAIHNTICDRILQFISEGLPHMPLVRFLENLMKNPSSRAVNELYDFLEHKGFPITEDGCFIGYKGVNADYTDRYSGTFDNTPNITEPRPGLKMPKVERNQVDDNRENECSWGLHVGTMEYARNYCDARLVLVKVNPMDAVSVPKDHDASKLRVSEYTVIGEAPQERIDSPMYPMPRPVDLAYDAYSEGEIAFENNEMKHQNPYDRDTSSHENWSNGWQDAADDYAQQDDEEDGDGWS